MKSTRFMTLENQTGLKSVTKRVNLCQFVKVHGVWILSFVWDRVQSYTCIDR